MNGWCDYATEEGKARGLTFAGLSVATQGEPGPAAAGSGLVASGQQADVGTPAHSSVGIRFAGVTPDWRERAPEHKTRGPSARAIN